MAFFSRDLRCFFRMQGPAAACTQRFLFSSRSAVRHVLIRGSKIEHNNGTADAKKMAQRSALAKEISAASKWDQAANTRLASAISTAKKAGFPKAYIEAAIARGQGVSTSGAALETLTLEVSVDNSRLAIDILSDNRRRTESDMLYDLRFLEKTQSGTVTPTNYLSQKWDKVLFNNSEKRSTIVRTEPSYVTVTANLNSSIQELKVMTGGIIGYPEQYPETSVTDELTLSHIIGVLHDNPNVHVITIRDADVREDCGVDCEDCRRLSRGEEDSQNYPLDFGEYTPES